MTEFKSLGLGPFEFPLSGKFSVSTEAGASVLTSADSETRITTSFFRFRDPTVDPTALIKKNEVLLKGNWIRFANEERGTIAREFQRILEKPEHTVFAMATEFIVKKDTQHYVQYAITDGPNMGVLIIEGFGSAADVVKRYDDILLRVTRVDR